MPNMESLVNNNFKVLAYLYDIKDKENLAKITQLEIGHDLGLNRGTISYVFKNLKENGYLIHDNTRVGRYYLTDDAVRTVEMFRKSDKKL